VVPPVEEETELPTRGVVSPASLRLSTPSRDDVAATSVGEKDAEPLSGDASQGLGIFPWRRPN